MSLPGLARPPSPATLSRWFIDRPARGPQAMIRLGSEVTAYIEVADYYNAAAAAIEATPRGETVLLAAWVLEVDTQVAVNGRPDTIGAVLYRAGARGVAVRVLLSGDLKNPNVRTAVSVNSRKGCKAILDDRLRLTGSFHQKALVISGPEGPIAFVGGMDFEEKRLRASDHPPYHDVQVRIVGGAANDVLDTLAARWNTMDARESLFAQVKHPRGPRAARSALRGVQVVRTYGNPQHGIKLTMLRPRNFTLLVPFYLELGLFNVFQFAPSGDSSIHDLLVHAIAATTETIYIEDQYFVLAAAIGGKQELLDALAATINKESFKKLVVLTCGVGTINGELRQVNRHRKGLWEHIAAVHPEKVSVWSYKDYHGTGGQDRVSWLHSKTWIFDDTFAVVGSANFNRRSLSTDGELAVGILDCEPAKDSNWVKDLRISLWLKHLPAADRPVARDQVADFVAGSAFWLDDADIKKSVLAKLDLVVGDPAQPDRLIDCSSSEQGWTARIAQSVMCGVGLPFVQLLPRPLLKFDGQWDLIDPDGS